MDKMHQNITIRAFRPQDIDALIALFQASVHKGTASEYSHAQRMAWAPDHIDRAAWLEKQND